MRKLPSEAFPVPRAAVRAGVLLLLLCVPVGTASARTPRGETTLATVGGDATITEQEFRSGYAAYLLTTGLADTRTLRMRFLERLVDDRLLAHDARARGATGDPSYRLLEERTRRKLLIDLVTRRTLYDTLQIAEEDLEETFVRMNTTLEARHLFARTLEGARLLQARLHSGVAFEKLAAEIFSDSALATSGGSVGAFSFDEMDAAFEDAAFSLAVGEISGPVRTAQGYSIIQLTGRFTHPLLREGDFAARRSNIEGYVLDRKRLQARTAHARTVAATLDLRFDEGSFNDLLRQISGTFVAPGQEAMEVWLDRPLVHFTRSGRRHSWTIRKFRDEAGYTDPEQRGQVRSAADLEAFIEGVLVRDALVAEASRRNLDATPHFDEALRAAMDDQVARWERERITAGIAVPEEDLRRAFEQYRTSHPMATFEEARPRLMAELREPVGRRAIASRVKALREMYAVQIDRERLAAIELAGTARSAASSPTGRVHTADQP